MVNAQEWLDNKYPNLAIKKSVKRIEFTGRRAFKEMSNISLFGEVMPRRRFFSDDFYQDDKKNLEGTLSLRGFDSLEEFNCPNNNLTAVDFSFCPKITKVDISHNEITNLTLSNNPELKTLYCWENHLSELDLTQNTRIYEIVCQNNQLKTLNLPDCPYSVGRLICHHNQLTKIELGKRYNLNHVSCENNQLKELDLSKCVYLKIEFDNDYLVEPKRIETNYSLISDFNCQDNQISSLKLPDLPKVIYFNCSNNQLTNFDFLYSITEEFEKLRKLDISSNKFPPTDLANIYPLKNFVDLEELNISNNFFYGSLEAFQNLTKLRELRIWDTDINWGLQYLPESVNHVNTNSQDRDSLVSKIWGRDKYYSLSPKSWKKDWEKKSPEEKIKELESRLKEQSQRIVNLKHLSIKEQEKNQSLKQLNSQLIQRLKNTEEQLSQIQIQPKQ